MLFKRVIILFAALFWPVLAAEAFLPNTAFFGRLFRPAAFAFTDQTGVALNTTATSNSLTLAGTGTRAVTAICTGCTLERNASGTWAASVSGFKKGDTIRIRLTSSGSGGTAVTATVAVGAVTSSVWSVTTVAYTYGWYQSGWSACPLNSWTYSYTSGCSPSCGAGTQSVVYVCNPSWNTQTQTVYCQRNDLTQVDDSYCSAAGPKPATSQSCYQTSCSGGDPSYTQACSNGACVTCPSQSITTYVGTQGSCTNTLPAYTGPSGTTVWGPTSWHYACRGVACTLGNSCGDTPYLGTISGGTYGTCLDYCNVKADCVNGTWTNYGYTW